MSDPIPVYIHLLRAKDRIDRHYAHELDVPTLARTAHASTRIEATFRDNSGNWFSVTQRVNASVS